MTDYHVHIGQWNDSYFFADRIFSALKKSGIEECFFSSTTSCIFCKESQAAKDDDEISKNAPTAIELYTSVRDEIKASLSIASKIGIKAHALYWVVPDIVRSGISIEQAMGEVKYAGFKLHPRAQKWEIDEIAEEVFNYAESHNIRILIHTGFDKEDSPKKFEPLIKSHPNCLVQLAHIKDIDAQEYMLNTYPNVMIDSSFSEMETVEELVRRGIDKDRILWGSDMPIPYVWKMNNNCPDEPTEKELSDFYANKIKKIQNPN